MANTILILNTGGTFNKIYNPIDGKLIIPKNNNAIKNIIKKAKLSQIKLKGIIYKDSLALTKKDRHFLAKTITKAKQKKIIIIHGTDTIDKTAKYLHKHTQGKQIVLIGAMIPYSIDEVEATANLMLAMGYLKSSKTEGIYIGMHSHIGHFDTIKKDRAKGIFISN